MTSDKHQGETIDEIIDGFKSPEKEAASALTNSRNVFLTLVNEGLPRYNDRPILPGAVNSQNYIVLTDDIELRKIILKDDGTLAEADRNSGDIDAISPVDDLILMGFGRVIMRSFCRKFTDSISEYDEPSEIEAALKSLDMSSIDSYFANISKARSLILGIDEEQDSLDSFTLVKIEKLRKTYELYSKRSKIREKLEQYSEALDRGGLTELIKELVTEYLLPNDLFPSPTMTLQEQGYPIWYPSRSPELMNRYSVHGSQQHHWCISQQGEIAQFDSNGHRININLGYENVDLLRQAPHVFDRFIEDIIRGQFKKIRM